MIGMMYRGYFYDSFDKLHKFFEYYEGTLFFNEQMEEEMKPGRVALPLFAILVVSCGESPEVISGSDRGNEPVLEISLSIGEEMGDSCYVFGDIRDACITEDGNIMVLDGTTSRISAYGPGGEFLYRGGGSGEGPGEFIRPYCLTTMSDDRLLVSDPGLTRITFLNPDLTVDTVISGFIPWSPERTAPSLNGSFTGSYRIFDRENSRYGRLLALWSDSPVQDLEYYSHTVDFNRERLRESTEESQIVFTSDFQGNVYYLPYSYTEFAVHVLDFQGNPIYTIEEDRIPRERPAEEIEEEREEVRQQLLAEGAPPEMRWDPSEYRPMVPFIGMGVDPEGRLWVRDGREEYPLFDVYAGGQHLFTVALEDPPPDADELRVKVTQRGILAWNPNPEDFPRLHILSLRE